MTKLIVGDKFTVADTPRNRQNGLVPGKDVRIAHVNNTHVSIRVFQSGDEVKLLVPLDAFGTNFKEDRTATVMAAAYKALTPFKELYK
ncbi:hypothetical protein [Tsuneonella sp. SYSU-LHT278]|uniref:hypothetical protein n=1 Tax=Tsuneonella sediminis TaxID=3416089 RepID=UPI003F7A78E1